MIKRLRSLQGDMRDKEFARVCGVPYSTMRGFLDGSSNPKPDAAIKIADAFGKSLDWFYGRATPSEVADVSMLSLPRFDIQASAGAGALVASESPNGWMAVDRDWLSRYVSRSANVGVIEAAGDSMAPTIRNRDLLLVEVRDGFTVQDLLRGGIYVLTLDGGLVVKRLSIDKDVLVVTSDNPTHAEVRVSFAELEDRVKIHGIVFWAGGALETHR